MKLIKHLYSYKKATITIEELESFFQGQQMEYQQFAQELQSLEDTRILSEVTAKGRNSRVPSVAYQYRINKAELRKPYHHELERYRQQLHSAIHLDRYFSTESTIFYEHLPYLVQIDRFLNENDFPIEAVPAPERSFQLVGDEKWITDKKGKELLDWVGLWQMMKILPVADPLMLAINANALVANSIHLHLIVENKTTWQALQPALKYTRFTSLIYGCGEKIINGIEQLETQLGIEQKETDQGRLNQQIYYFGDIDPSGIDIWYRLQKVRPIFLAQPFYLACIEKSHVKGKENQRLKQEALDSFLEQFPDPYSHNLKQVIELRHYYPQEILTTRELQRIWRDESLWSSLIPY